MYPPVSLRGPGVIGERPFRRVPQPYLSILRSLCITICLFLFLKLVSNARQSEYSTEHTELSPATKAEFCSKSGLFRNNETSKGHFRLTLYLNSSLLKEASLHWKRPAFGAQNPVFLSRDLAGLARDFSGCGAGAGRYSTRCQTQAGAL